MKSSLYYREEHQSCKNYQVNDVTFDFKRTEGEEEILARFISSNVIILFLEGTFKVNSLFLKDKIIGEDNMIALPQGVSYKITTSKNARLLFFNFQSPSSSCAKQILYSYKYENKSLKNNGFLLKIKEPVSKYVELLDLYLANDIKCEHLLEMKKDEFFLSLRWFYSKEDLSSFFYPIHQNTCSFKKIILENLDNVNNVSELIDLCNMSKSLFYKRFREEFGMSAKQWLIAHLKERMMKKILEPEITAKDLMNEFNFSSPEYLTLFCKKQFGMTPSQLIRRHQT